MKKTILITLASAAITAVAIKAAPAAAQPIETPTRIVQTADLNLASLAGQRSLDRRLARAAREVCGTPSDLDLVGKRKVEQCRTATLASIRDRRDAILVQARGVAGVEVAAIR